MHGQKSQILATTWKFRVSANFVTFLRPMCHAHDSENFHIFAQNVGVCTTREGGRIRSIYQPISKFFHMAHSAAVNVQLESDRQRLPPHLRVFDTLSLKLRPKGAIQIYTVSQKGDPDIIDCNLLLLFPIEYMIAGFSFKEVNLAYGNGNIEIGKPWCSSCLPHQQMCYCYTCQQCGF